MTHSRGTVMFEEAAQLGATERSIDLATTKGRRIANVVEVDELPAHAVRAYADLVKRCGQGWQERKPATGRYNCGGHVWASRRTCILDPAEYQAIIQDDGYRIVRSDEAIYPGDLVVYLDRDRANEILHVGRVYRLVEGLTPRSRPIPQVISKWNSTSGESLHNVYDVPYSRHFNLEVRYLTDRP